MHDPFAHLAHEQEIMHRGSADYQHVSAQVNLPPATYIPARYRDLRGRGAATLTLGIVSMIIWPLGPVAILTGHLGFIGSPRPRPSGWGMAVAGITLGWISTAFCLLIVAEVVARHHG